MRGASVHGAASFKWPPETAVCVGRLLAGCTLCTPYEYYSNNSSCNDLERDSILKAAILRTNRKEGSALRLIKARDIALTIQSIVSSLLVVTLLTCLIRSRNVDPTAPEKSYVNMNDQRRKKKRVDSRVPSSVVFCEWKRRLSKAGPVDCDPSTLLDVKSPNFCFIRRSWKRGTAARPSCQKVSFPDSGDSLSSEWRY